MDSTTFDRLVRSIGSTSSRRRALGLLTSLGLGGLLSHLTSDGTEAKRKRHGRRRSHRPGRKKDNRKGKGKRNSGLTDPASCTQGSQCGSGETCNAATGQCQGPACRTHLQTCSATDQCCSTDHTACAENNVVIGENVCCSTLSGTCTTGGPSGDCCSVNVPGGADYAYCSPSGACGGEGAVCRFNEACVTGQCCKASPSDDSGVCSGPDGCCRTHLQPCSSTAQCCSTDHTACAPNNVVIGQNVCCSTLGGTCTVGGPSGDCCGVNVPLGQDYAYCSSATNGTCGGAGAQCRFDEACVSGHCCGPFFNTVGTCSGPAGC